MEQKDYVLREIEKIGVIIRAMLQKLFGRTYFQAISVEKQMEAEKGLLLEEVNFDLDKFLLLDSEFSAKYIESFRGFNVENIELLAEGITQMGLIAKSKNSRKYLEKALQLYEICKMRDKTYSIRRETTIKMIKEAL